MFPIHLNLGSFHMFFYEGLYFALSIGLGMLLGFRTLERQGFKDTQYVPLALLAILGALLGGRLFHVVFWGGAHYLANPGDILAFWKGGISITGGIAGALVVALVHCRRTGQSFLRYLALLAPVILIAQGVGRLGCFANGDAFGIPTNLPWGVEFARYGSNLFTLEPDTRLSSAAWQWCMEHGLVASRSTHTVPMHPTQLYEALFDFALAGLLILLGRRKVADGTVSYLYLAGYSLFRFGVEYIRGDREEIIALDTSLMQFVLLAAGLVFAGLTVRAVLRSRRQPVPVSSPAAGTQAGLEAASPSPGGESGPSDPAGPSDPGTPGAKPPAEPGPGPG